MSLLLRCLLPALLLSSCVLPPPESVKAVPGPWGFLVAGHVEAEDGRIFQIENRDGERAPTCPECLLMCPDGVEEGEDACVSLAFLVDIVRRDSDGAYIPDGGQHIGAGLGVQEIDDGEFELMLFTWSVPLKDPPDGDDGWGDGWLGTLERDGEEFVRDEFWSDDGSLILCWDATDGAGNGVEPECS